MEEYIVKINDEGTIRWYQRSKLHRLDGPAVDCVDGYKAWYRKGKLHRVDGPAIEYTNGLECWFINGIEYTKDEFDKVTK